MLYTGPQLRVLSLLALTLLVGLGVREWRAGFPDAADRLEGFDREESPGPLLPEVASPPAGPTRAHPGSPAGIARAEPAPRPDPAAAISPGAGMGSHAAAVMPAVKAAAGSRSGAASSRGSITHGDEAADGREFLGPHAQDIAESLGRVESPAPLALLDDALGEPRSHAG